MTLFGTEFVGADLLVGVGVGVSFMGNLRSDRNQTISYIIAIPIQKRTDNNRDTDRQTDKHANRQNTTLDDPEL